ncbi:MAG: type II toxin-antitoxin system HicA family toxin [Deltaproteobacteria bacterium]|nr:MAG: type II toxin-antitoxin system HicA family toxin [Deltaproteobacteria bacterium]
MPRKIRELIQELKKAGFQDRGGKGSHRNFSHSLCPMPVTISGKEGDDAKHYQEKAIKQALQIVRDSNET